LWPLEQVAEISSEQIVADVDQAAAHKASSLSKPAAAIDAVAKS
jgi:hypothetical protein